MPRGGNCASGSRSSSTPIFPAAELQVRNEPLLPHFSFNIRSGDSLLQEIGGINLAQIRADFSGIPRSLKARVTRLKNEKLKFFNTDPTCRYTEEWELEKEELNLFRDLLDTQAKDVKQQIDDLQELVDGPGARQMQLDGSIDENTAHQFELQAAEWRVQIEALTADRNRLVEARGVLANAPTSPFVWDISFVEIFSDDKGGFDLVIGNPPYVRHKENIAEPNHPREDITPDNKKAYKAKIARSVYQAFPDFFGYKREKDKPDNPSAAVSHIDWTPIATSTSTSIFTGFPYLIPRDRSVSSPPTHGWMSATGKTFRSSS